MARKRTTKKGLKTSAQVRISGAMVKKASKCIRLAKAMLPVTAEKAVIEEQAVALMDMDDGAIEATTKRLAQGQNEGDAFYPKEYSAKDTHPEKGKLVKELSGSKRVKAEEDELYDEVDEIDVPEDGVVDDVEIPEGGEQMIEVTEAIPLTEVPTEELEEELASRAADTEEEAEIAEEPEMDMAASADANDPASYQAEEGQASDEIDLPDVAEKAASVANRLARLAKKHPGLGRLAIAGAEVVEGLVSPDDAKPDQSNEENPAYKPGFEGPATQVQKVAPSKRPKASRRVVKATPASEIADPTPNPEKKMSYPFQLKKETDLPDSHSTSEDLIAHKAASEIDVGSGEIGLDATLADVEQEDTEIASDEDVLDVLFEADEAAAAEKMASIRTKAASKKGARKIASGPRAASKRGSEVDMLEKSVWSSKPDVSSHFGQ